MHKFEVVPQVGHVTSRCVPKVAWWSPLGLFVPAPARQALVGQLVAPGLGRRLAQLLVNCGGGLLRWLFRSSSLRVICMSSYSCLIQSLAVNLLNALVKYQTPHSHWWCIVFFPLGLRLGAGSPVQTQPPHGLKTWQ